MTRAKTSDDRATAAAALADAFERDLEPHFIVEEELLLVPLRALGELAMVQRTEDDHAFLRAGAALAKAGQDFDVNAYGERLREHVRFEERELFECAQNCLPSEILDAVWERAPKLN